MGGNSFGQSFLSALGNTASGNSQLGFIPDLLGGILGSSGDRISNRDYQFYQDLADSGNPREIARQNQFLAGVTPNNADQYNLYQDMTQPQDTQRQIDRIMETSRGTGMSPWELNGGSGATPLPAAQLGPSSGKSEAAGFLAQLTPLLAAQMNNQTALQTTAMNNDTAKEINAQTTGTSVKTTQMNNETAQWIADFQQNGPKAQVERLNTAADTILKTAQTATAGAQKAQAEAQTGFLKGQTANLPAERALKESQTALNINSVTVAQRASMLDAIRTLVTLIPEDKWTTGAYTRTERPGANNIIPILKGLANNQGSGDAITGLTDLQLNDAVKWAIGMAGTIKDGAGVFGKTAKGALDTAKRLTPSEY